MPAGAIGGTPTSNLATMGGGTKPVLNQTTNPYRVAKAGGAVNPINSLTGIAPMDHAAQINAVMNGQQPVSQTVAQTSNVATAPQAQTAATATAAPYTGTSFDYGYVQPATTPTIPSNLFEGLGAAAPLDLSNMQLQQFTPTNLGTEHTTLDDYNAVLNALSGASGGLQLNSMTVPQSLLGDLQGYTGSLSGLVEKRDALANKLKEEQNANLAGTNATAANNAQTISNLQQSAIAENRLLGELNRRGLLGSYESGGMGTADMQQLQNALYGSADQIGQNLQNELSGLNLNDQGYQMQLNNYLNSLGNFNKYKQSQQPGLTDILGLGGSAVDLITGL
jgi:hypothetical protein